MSDGSDHLPTPVRPDASGLAGAVVSFASYLLGLGFLTHQTPVNPVLLIPPEAGIAGSVRIARGTTLHQELKHGARLGRKALAATQDSPIDRRASWLSEKLLTRFLGWQLPFQAGFAATGVEEWMGFITSSREMEWLEHLPMGRNESEDGDEPARGPVVDGRVIYTVSTDELRAWARSPIENREHATLGIAPLPEHDLRLVAEVKPWLADLLVEAGIHRDPRRHAALGELLLLLAQCTTATVDAAIRPAETRVVARLSFDATSPADETSTALGREVRGLLDWLGVDGTIESSSQSGEVHLTVRSVRPETGWAPLLLERFGPLLPPPAT